MEDREKDLRVVAVILIQHHFSTRFAVIKKRTGQMDRSKEEGLCVCVVGGGGGGGGVATLMTFTL